VTSERCRAQSFGNGPNLEREISASRNNEVSIWEESACADSASVPL
jgi:hypothetical protein